MNREQLAQKIAEYEKIQPWNHNISLPDGLETRPGHQTSHGKNLVKIKRLRPLFEMIGLKGKAVIDVGCNEGFFSLEMAKEGARVIGLDIDEHRIEKALFVKSALGENNVDFKKMDIYSEEFNNLPHADLCLCLGFLHRVPDPFSVVAALAKKTDMIIFEWKALKFGPHDEAFAYFTPKPVNEADYYGTEYWLLSFAALERMLTRQGFNFFHRIDDPRQRRAIMVAGRNKHPIFEQPATKFSRGRLRILLSHSKRFANTVIGILSGRINA
ncbi:MAG: methyltransferase domain-containing protein [Alphaproteobacteria bacterium]|nr:methyltransferase domain-containing protein [Alphaproteobacteria bacterium]